MVAGSVAMVAVTSVKLAPDLSNAEILESVTNCYRNFATFWILVCRQNQQLQSTHNDCSSSPYLQCVLC